MKKKILSLVLVVAMLMTFAISASAATITVSNAVDGQEYTAYKVFEISENADRSAITYYTTNADLVTALTNHGVTFTQATDGKYYVDQTGFNAATLAAYIGANLSTLGLTAETPVTAADGEAEITVGPGYYFVDSSTGALCAVLDAEGNFEAIEKNDLPTLAKAVKENAADEFAASTTADEQQTVTYKLTVTIGEAGLDKDYTITDTMPAGVTYTAGTTVPATYQPNVAGSVLTFTIPQADLEAALADGEETIEITYDAVVNENAVIGGAGNVNTASLTYGTYTTEEATATVYTYEIGDSFAKVDGTTNAPLAGVGFTVKNITTGDPLNGKYVVVGTDYKVTGTQAAANTIYTDTNGQMNIQGLDAGTYEIEEVAPLAGYNNLTNKIILTIAENGAVTYTYSDAPTASPAPSVSVENFSGTELPSTGGIGTTIFYALGAILVIGAGVLLITKKRTNA